MNIRETEETLNYIKNNYGIQTAKTIGLKLGLTTARVISIAYRLGLKSNLSRQSSKPYRCGQPEPLEEYLGSKTPIAFRCPFCKNRFFACPEKIKSGHTKSCGCVAFGKRRGTTNVSSTYYTSLKQAAQNRNIEFQVSIEYLDKLLIEQNFKCKLSGRDIACGYLKIGQITASVDRIDNRLGYIEGNIQWVHKHINLLKHTWSQSEFIQMCKDVANHNE